MPPASPMATPMRASSRNRKLPARPQSMVIRLQPMQAMTITGLRPMRSDSRPSGKPNRVKNSAKVSPESRPIWVSEMANSAFTGSMRIAISCRSM